MRLFVFTVLCEAVLALPTCPLVQEGDVQIRFDEKFVDIQTGDFAELHWDHFSIGADEHVRFLQPDASSIAINKVISTHPSNLFGRLESIGQVVLINQNGILVGKEAIIDTGSFIAVTSDLLNEGTVFARDAEVKISADSIINKGSIHARKIFLEAPESTIAHYGTVLAPGGEIYILGGANHLHEGSLVDVSGPTGGGTVLIGGDYKGQNPKIPNSRHTWVASGVTVLANATECGDGGKVIFWGDESNYFRGTAEARGGPLGGNGGLIEISSKGNLDPGGDVNTMAPFGRQGELFLDPCVVTISAAANSGISAFPPPGYTFSGAAANISTVAPTTLATFLAASDVTIDASSSGSAAVGSITVNDGVLWASPNKLTLIANGFIQVNETLGTTQAGLAATTPSLELTAPTVQIGPSAAVAQVFSFSGQIIVNAPTSLSIFSSGPPGGRQGIQAGSFGAPATVVVRTGALLLSATDTSTVIDSSLGNDIRATGNIQLLAGNGLAEAEAQIITFLGGDNLISAMGNLNMVSGSGAVALDTIIGNLGGGNISVDVLGDISLQAGANSLDGVSGIIMSGTGNIQVQGRDISLTSGNGTGDTYAIIGTIFAGSGSTTVTATGPNGIDLNAAGSGLAIIGSPGGVLGGMGDVTVNTTHLNLNGSTVPGSTGGDAHIFSVNGNVIVNATGDITAIGGSGAGDNSARIISSTAGNSIAVTARNITLLGGTAITTQAIIHSRFGPVNCNILGDYFFQSGSGTNSATGIGAATNGGTGDLVISGRNFTVMGGSGPFSATGCTVGNPIVMGLGEGSLFLSATGSVTLIGGSGPTGLATISTNGTLLTNSLTMQVANNLSVIGGSGEVANIFTLGGPLSVRVGNDITMTSNTFDAAVFINAGDSDLYMEAGRNMSVASSIDHFGTGDIYLVVDANFPQPFIGPGSFNLSFASTLSTSGGAIRIFTSQQPLNSILGTINGLSFTPGALFVNTNQEVWCIYYPSLIGGTPFTIFYKDCLQLLASQAEIIISENLEQLHPYNAFPGWWARFTLSSDRKDLTLNTSYFIRRRFSPAFRLPKSYETW